MASRVAVDEECCIGCGTCAELCPEVFEMTGDGEKSRVILPDGGEKDCVRDAIAGCPCECISLEN